MKTYVLSISYDGTNYYGWQKQPNVPTIQGELEKRLKKLFGATVKTVGASRTDRGVHALEQIVAFEANPKYEPADLARRLNKMLPNDIAVNGATFAENGFNPRFDAVGKLYEYHIITQKNPFKARYSLFVDFSAPEYAVKKLNEISRVFLGEHNFSAFSIAKDLPENPECTIKSSHWKMEKDEIVYFVVGNRFLRKMVRSMVGAMLEYTNGKLSLGDVKDMLLSGRKVKEFKVAPPQGLFLVKVYFNEEEL